MDIELRSPDENPPDQSPTGSEGPLDEDGLLEPFEQAFKPRSAWRVGTEAEKFGLVRESLTPVSYGGPAGVMALFAGLVEKYGWVAEREHEGGDIIALRRNDASVTLEPGGQLELSGAPFRDVHATEREMREHLDELRDLSAPHDLAWFGLGFQPFARQADLPWVPKLRYGIMKNYLPTRGQRGRDMMRRTATVQANFDFESEQDAMRKLRVSLALSPLCSAMFANSPIMRGRPCAALSERARVWLDTDPDRAGLLPFAWHQDARLEDYVQWALDVPMFMVKRGSEALANTGQTFRAFMKDGFEGHRPTLTDWRSHLATLFPEARLKNTLEVRCVDSQPTELVCAVPALWKGILYDEAALNAAEALVEGLDHDAVQASREPLSREGLRGQIAGRPAQRMAQDLVSIARAGLERIAHLDEYGRDEGRHLDALEDLVSRGLTPADVLLDRIEQERARRGSSRTDPRNAGTNPVRTALFASREL